MRRIAGIVSLLGSVACAQRESPPQQIDVVVDRAAVERTITVWFDSALATLDTARVRASLADDFAILEDSVWYDRDGFVAFVAGLPSLVGGPFTLEYALSDWRTTVEGDVAWTSLTNRALLVPAKGDTLRLAWRETAVLRRRDAAWQIARYHSAPIR